MSPSAREYLQHILDETKYITSSSCGLDKATFLQDETLKRAYVRSIEVIGEAVKQLPDRLRQKYTSILTNKKRWEKPTSKYSLRSAFPKITTKVTTIPNFFYE
jgi:uncharacterized protein with HEPN domain